MISRLLLAALLAGTSPVTAAPNHLPKLRVRDTGMSSWGGEWQGWTGGWTSGWSGGWPNSNKDGNPWHHSGGESGDSAPAGDAPAAQPAGNPYKASPTQQRPTKTKEHHHHHKHHRHKATGHAADPTEAPSASPQESVAAASSSAAQVSSTAAQSSSVRPCSESAQSTSAQASSSTAASGSAQSSSASVAATSTQPEAPSTSSAAATATETTPPSPKHYHKSSPTKMAPLSHVAAVAGAVASAATGSYQHIVLHQHNIHRANHSAPALTWSSDLASIASQIAQSCTFAHNVTAGGGGYGQNIAAGTPASEVAKVITNQFYDNEEPNYAGLYGLANPPMTNFEDWGHFSQVVWKATTQVGCATQYCAKGVAKTGSDVPPYFTVCNYKSPGNFAGQYGKNVLKPLGHKNVVIS